MNSKKQLKLKFIDLINSGGSSEIWQFHKWLTELESKYHRNHKNKGKPWADEELQLLFLHAPTKENVVRFAKLFQRSSGSIEQIYRWAATPQIQIMRVGRADNAFVQQIKRVAKESGWVI